MIVAPVAALDTARPGEREVDLKRSRAAMDFVRNRPGEEERAGAEKHLRTETVPGAFVVTAIVMKD
jgi:hypothetical protein